MNYLSEDGEELRLHTHPFDETCHWQSIFKPLSFTVFRDSQLTQALVESPLRNGLSINTFDYTYVKWLTRTHDDGLINLIHVFLVVLRLRGLPVPHNIATRT